MNIQRLLDEGLFTASYKFALLLALAVLSIEEGDDSGEPLELTTDSIAEKFVQYYWRQVVPYATAGEATILQQNTDRQAAIVNLVREAHAQHGGSLAAAMLDVAGWRAGWFGRWRVWYERCLCGGSEDRGGTVELHLRESGRR